VAIDQGYKFEDLPQEYKDIWYAHLARKEEETKKAREAAAAAQQSRSANGK
jgi:hypothetical protein